MLEKEIEEYLNKKLIGIITCEYKYSEDIDRYYDTLTIKQETFSNTLYHYICFDHRWNFEEEFKEKLDKNIMSSIMSSFIK